MLCIDLCSISYCTLDNTAEMKLLADRVGRLLIGWYFVSVILQIGWEEGGAGRRDEN